jgi:uncharacterized protein YkwD
MMGTSSVLAAPANGDTTNPTIIPVQTGSSQSTTPNECQGAISNCTTQILKLINHDRTTNGLSKLTLKPAQSVGGPSCVGSYGHSIAMAKSGAIWHINPKFPRASFPNSICVKFLNVGENVGESASGDVTNDLKTLDSMMMSEPHSKGDCASDVNHACNILNPKFHQVGIGVYYVNGATWLTEDFTN